AADVADAPEAAAEAKETAVIEPVDGATGAPVAPVIDGPTGKPALWRVADEDTEVFLFGTLHVLPPNVQWSSDIYDMSMRIADVTVTEADTKSPEAAEEIKAAVQKFGLNPPGVNLSSTLGPERTEKLNTLAAELGVPSQALEPMRPWLALITLTQVLLQKSGFDPGRGVEAIVSAEASEQGDTFAFLESVSFQIETLASLDHTEMMANFDTTLTQFEEFDALTNRLLTAWKTGDVEALERDITEPLRNVSPAAYGTLFTKRNTTWTDEIEARLDGSGNYFYAVGAGHLVGEDSVIEMLQQRGRTVVRIQ
ncbi:MAG: TraB/GumN family protein, partial [Pseudomonadota bacterium]